MKILVTGGAGFIGSHITDLYIDSGHEVLVVDDLSTGKRENLNPKAKFAELNINDPKLSSLISDFKPEIINHQAAQIDVRKSVADPAADAMTNIVGTLKLLVLASNSSECRKVIFASTGGAIYGDTNDRPTDETHPTKPLSPYGVAKLSVEHYLYYFNQIHNLNYVVLRYANVYGPRQNPHGEAGVVAIALNKLLADQAFTINGTGKQTRDFVYVTDVALASLAVLSDDVGGIYNIGTSIETSINQVVDLIAQEVGKSQLVSHGAAKPGEQLTSCLSYTKASRDFAFEPKVQLSQGIIQTAEFFRQRR